MTFEEIFGDRIQSRRVWITRRCCAASESVSDCAASCTACADACLSEDDLPVLIRCIRLNLDCADACDVTGRTLARQTAADLSLISATVKACAVACRACGEECERHAARRRRALRLCLPSLSAAASGHATTFSR